MNELAEPDDEDDDDDDNDVNGRKLNGFLLLLSSIP